MNILFIKIFFVGFMVSEIPRMSVFGYFPLVLLLVLNTYTNIRTGHNNIYILIYIVINGSQKNETSCLQHTILLNSRS